MSQIHELPPVILASVWTLYSETRVRQTSLHLESNININTRQYPLLYSACSIDASLALPRRLLTPSKSSALTITTITSEPLEPNVSGADLTDVNIPLSTPILPDIYSVSA